MHNFSIVNLKPKSNCYQGVTQNYRNVKYWSQFIASSIKIYVHIQSIFELGQMNTKSRTLV